MTESPRKNGPIKPDTLGFLAIFDSDQSGVIGGYLIINKMGQPVEFHCTAPIHVNRAQEILYGATLRPYLYGEQVAATLIEKAKSRPRLVCVQAPATASARGISGVPMVRLAYESTIEQEARPVDLRVLSEGDLAASHTVWQPIRMPNVTAWVLSDYAADAEVAAEILDECGRHFQVQEPFQRIHLAICEAAKGYPNHGDRQAAG